MSEAQAIVITGIVAGIISLVTVAASIVTVALTNRLSADTKTKEIKLQNFHKDQIEAVKMLYSLIVELSYANNSLFYSSTEKWGHEKYAKILKTWISSFNKIYAYYNINRILLLDKNKLSAEIRSSLNNLSSVLYSISKENKDLDQLEEYYEGQLAYAHYGNELEEIDEIRKRLEILKNTPELASTKDSLNIIRANLEAYFHELTT